MQPPMPLSRWIEQQRRLREPLVDLAPLGVQRWKVREARRLSPDLASAVALVEAAHSPVGTEPLSASPSRLPWVPVQEPPVDTSVEEKFVRVTLARMAAAESRSAR